MGDDSFGKPGAHDDRLDGLFFALSEPTRRVVLSRLVSGPCRAGDLAEEAGTSPAALSRHLRVLRSAGLIEEERDVTDARIHWLRLAPDALGPARDWITRLETLWQDQLAAFAEHVDQRVRKDQR